MKHFALSLLGVLLIATAAVSATAADAPQEKSVTGTLTDTYCYSTMGAHGPSHKQCAMGCAKKGIPVGLREKDGKMLILLPPKDDEPLPAAVINNMEDEVTVTGKEYETGGVTFLTVESVK